MLNNFYFILKYYILYCLLIPILLIILELITLKKLKIYNRYRNFLIENVLDIKHEFIGNRKSIEKGIIISNHKSGFDNLFDSYITNSILLGKNSVKYYHGFFYFLQIINNDILLFDKYNTNRHKLYTIIKKYMKINNRERLIFYPEGTRVKMKYKNQDEILNKIKYGLLKSLFENDDVIYLLISINKEFPFNFKNMKIYSKLSEPIDPKKFITFEEFYSHITKLWIEYLTELRKYNYLKQN